VLCSSHNVKQMQAPASPTYGAFSLTGGNNNTNSATAANTNNNNNKVS
jgi:hypothetical protein